MPRKSRATSPAQTVARQIIKAQLDQRIALVTDLENAATNVAAAEADLSEAKTRADQIIQEAHRKAEQLIATAHERQAAAQSTYAQRFSAASVGGWDTAELEQMGFPTPTRAARGGKRKTTMPSPSRTPSVTPEDQGPSSPTHPSSAPVPAPSPVPTPTAEATPGGHSPHP